MIHAKPFPRHRSYEGPVYIVVLALMLFVIAQLALPRIRIWIDDWRYGRPRTMHLAAHVGHEDGGLVPTQFVAMNLNRQPIVIEFPGGDVNKARILKLPYLFGADEDLTPVDLTLGLINSDKEPDLVVSIKDEEVIYINENGSFRLITDAERAALGAANGD